MARKPTRTRPRQAPPALTARGCPLEVQPVVDSGGQVLAVFAKGHQPGGCVLAVDRFLAAVGRYLVELGLLDDDVTPDPATARFETWRCVPDPHDPDSPVRFHPATPGRQGAFPVTVLDLDDLQGWD